MKNFNAGSGDVSVGKLSGEYSQMGLEIFPEAQGNFAKPLQMCLSRIHIPNARESLADT